MLFLARVVLAQEPTPILPDPKLTPGDTFDVAAQDLCVPGYARKVRNVPEEMKREVYQEYGVTLYGPGDYEVDHLIPLELGRLEAKLHKLVCSGQLELKTAQQVIASNWIKAYKTYISANLPSSRLGSSVCSKSRQSLSQRQKV